MPNETKPEHNQSVVRVLIATIAVGLASFVYKVGVSQGAAPIALVAVQGAVATMLATTFAVYVDRGIRPSRAALGHAPITALLLVVAFIWLAKGLEQGEASVVVPIAQMGFVVTALLGFVVLGEPMTARKGAGLFAAFLALASLTAS
jgi:transporter family protein